MTKTKKCMIFNGSFRALCAIGMLGATGFLGAFCAAAARAEDSPEESRLTTLYAGTLATQTGSADIQPSQGIYRLEIDPQNDAIHLRCLAARAKNPSFLAKNPKIQGVFYSVSDNEDGKSRESLIIAWKRRADGTLERLNELNSAGTCACHIATHPDGTFVAAANYCSGQVSFFSLLPDGSLDKLNAVHTFEGSGPNRARQKQPHAHYVNWSNDGRFAYCCDLGSDKIWCFAWDAEKKAWEPNALAPFTTVASGSGPRHLTFSPNGKYVYVLNELSCTLAAFVYDSETGALTNVQTTSTLPVGYRGLNKAAAIDVHPSGKYVYCSNRGANIISVFAVDPEPVDGAIMQCANVLTPIQFMPCGGDAPRFAGLTPDGKYFLACNKKTHNVVLFKVDTATGKLFETGNSAALAWCVGIVY
ncbi:MAG: lactonase family protein [Planctomycetia bacterium]|nr:lactonase family protein [Planctomycetia bacterium]